MADQFLIASRWLARQRRSNATRRVYYLRGASSVQLSATLGASDFQREDANGFPIQFKSVDFLFDAADLILDGAPATPQRGDQIIDGTLTAGVVYELMDNGGGPPWRYADAYREVYRVHTKQVETRT